MGLSANTLAPLTQPVQEDTIAPYCSVYKVKMLNDGVIVPPLSWQQR